MMNVPDITITTIGRDTENNVSAVSDSGNESITQLHDLELTKQIS